MQVMPHQSALCTYPKEHCDNSDASGLRREAVIRRLKPPHFVSGHDAAKEEHGRWYEDNFPGWA